MVSFEVLDESLMGDAKKLSQAVVKATNKAMKKAQTIAAEKMKPLMGGMGLGQ
jgi:DNA-binding protein YbaB